MKRFITVVTLVALMAGFGFGVNRFIASRKTSAITHNTVVAPTSVKTNFTVPGTLFLAQQGHIYTLHDSVFTELPLPKGGWMQPAVASADSIFVINRSDAFSDLSQVSTNGKTVNQLTNNAGQGDIDTNHWVFWPRLGADGQTLFTSYDSPKSGYNVGLAIWSGSFDNPFATQWTSPAPYTGGDVEVAPLASGAIIYVHYAFDSDSKARATIVYQASADADPVDLTQQSDDCSEPSVSNANDYIAMVCSNGGQSTHLVVAPLQGATMGAPHTLVDNCTCASPTWAPDGSGLLYLAPHDASGHFQAWWIAGAETATPKPTQLMTNDLDFDATSPPLWIADPVKSPAPAAKTP